MNANPPAVEIRYHAAEACPDEAAFRVALARRTTGASARTSRVRAFDVAIEADPRGWVGRLTTQDVDGAASAREVIAPSCGEVTEAVAFFCAVAMGFDSFAIVEPAPPPPPKRDAPPAEEIPPAKPVASSPSVTIAVGITMSAIHDVVGPDVRPGIFGFVGLGRASGSWLDPSARLGFMGTTSDGFRGRSGSATVSLLAARLDACPVVVRRWRLEARPCAQLQVGALVGAGSGVAGARGGSLPWIAIGPMLRAAWNVIGRFSLEFEGGVSFAAATHRFYFVPSETLYESPIVGEWLGVGVELGLL